ncbi:MAG: cell division protein FtsZ, partial [Pseudorhodobacter sp.]
DVLYQGVKGVTDLMVRPGLINLDFADVRAVMDEMGKAMMGTGEATGDDRAQQAAEKAIANPLLDEISLNGAKGVLINITGGYDLTLFELDEAANIIREKVDPDANIIVGSTLDPSLEGALRVSVVATGIDASAANRADTPVARRSMAAPLPAAFTAPEPETARPMALKVTSAAASAPSPVVAASPQPAAEAPSLFDRVERHTPAAFHQDEEAEMEEAVDDLPPPAYRPQPAAAAPQARSPIDADAAEFVAPRPRAVGTPSPEALARLQAAVSKAPAQRAAAPAPAQPAAEAPRPRFGIGSLINRMAGHGEAAAERPAPVVRQQPPVTGYDEDGDANADQQRIEIPAFLRRQAN